MQDDKSNVDIRIRIATYYEDRQEPHVHVIAAASPREATRDALRYITTELVFLDSSIPEEALKELLDNLVHAEYRGALVSLLRDGHMVRVSDKGPGIEDKERAFMLGYSGANPEVLQEIRGVGAGLGIAREAAKKAGSMVFLDDNIEGGTVATISMSTKPLPAYMKRDTLRSQHLADKLVGKKGPDALVYEDDQGQSQVISARQIYVLLAVFEGGIVGPTAVADRLITSTSTAYRELVTLTEKHLVVQPGEFEAGKYALTGTGQLVIEELLGIQKADDYATIAEAVSEILDKVMETGVNTLGGYNTLKALRHTSTVDTEDAREIQD